MLCDKHYEIEKAESIAYFFPCCDQIADRVGMLAYSWRGSQSWGGTHSGGGMLTMPA